MNPNAFLSDIPDTSDPQQPAPRVMKAELTTPQALNSDQKHAPLTNLATNVRYAEGSIKDYATTVYMLIDDTTPPDGMADPMLAQAYQSLTKAAQLLFEARTHIYRYANKLDTQEIVQQDL